LIYYCWCCYGRNERGTGPCARCAGEIAAPPNTTLTRRLLWATRHPDPDVAIMATRRLAAVRATDAIPSLRSLITDPPDPYVAAEALRTLIELSGTEAEHAFLVRLAESGPALLRSLARSFLSR
jgi:hypothetical protein